MEKLKFDISNINNYKDLLQKEGFNLFENQSAFFRAKKNDITLIFYTNGTLQIQTNDILKKDSILNLLSIDNIDRNSKIDSILSLEGNIVGFDESGKGDYFGPIVFAGAYIKKDDVEKLSKTKIKDSKLLSDDEIRKIYEQILAFDIKIEKDIILPQLYNELYEKYKNLNKLMIDRYIALIKKFEILNPDFIIIDKFSLSTMQENELRKSIRSKLIIEEKAEKYPCVALASIVARYNYITELEKLEKEFNIKLPKGASNDIKSIVNEIKAKGLSKYLLKEHFKVNL